MKISVNAKLDMAKFFSDAVCWPLECKVSVVDEKIVLLKFDLVEEEKDLSKVLNDMFGLNLPEGEFFVNKLGFVMLAQVSGDKNEKTLMEIFPEVLKEGLPDVIQSLKPSTTPSLCFWSLMELKKVYFFNSLLEIGYSEEGGGELALIAIISNEIISNKTYSKIEFSAELSDFAIFKIFEFYHVMLCFKEGTFRLQGKIDLELFGKKYCFSGDLEVKEESCSATMSIGEGSGDVPTLFKGNMSGITFEEIQLCIDHRKEDGGCQTQVYIIGKVPICNAKLEGRIYLVGVEPKFAIVFLNFGSLSISSLVETVCSVKWPSDFIDLTIESGSYIYYLSEESDKFPYSIEYTQKLQQGFNVYLKMKLQLFTEFEMDGNLSVLGKYYKAELSLHNEIDFGFLSLSGVSLCFESNEKNEKNFYLKCSLSILGKKIDVKVKCEKYEYEKGKSEIKLMVEIDLTNSLDSIKKYLPTKKMNLTMSYSNHCGLELKNWPKFKFAECGAKLIKEIKEFIENTKKDVCSKSWDTIFEKIFDVTFETSAGFSKDSSLDLDLTIHFIVAKHEIANTTITEIVKVSLNSDLTMDKLPDLIRESIEGSLKSIAKAVVENPDIMGALLAYLAGKEVGGFVASLVCKGFIDALSAMAIVTAEAALEKQLECVAEGAGIAIAGMTVFEIISNDKIKDDDVKKAEEMRKNAYNGEEKQLADDEVPRKPNVLVKIVDAFIVVQWEKAEHALCYEFHLWDQSEWPIPLCKFSKIIFEPNDRIIKIPISEEFENNDCKFKIDYGHFVKIELSALNGKHRSEIESIVIGLPIDYAQILTEYMNRSGDIPAVEAIVGNARKNELCISACCREVLARYPFINLFDLMIVMYQSGYSFDDIILLIRNELEICKNMSDEEIYERYFESK